MSPTGESIIEAVRKESGNLVDDIVWDQIAKEAESAGIDGMSLTGRAIVYALMAEHGSRYQFGKKKHPVPEGGDGAGEMGMGSEGDGDGPGGSGADSGGGDNPPNRGVRIKRPKGYRGYGPGSQSGMTSNPKMAEENDDSEGNDGGVKRFTVERVDAPAGQKVKRFAAEQSNAPTRKAAPTQAPSKTQKIAQGKKIIASGAATEDDVVRGKMRNVTVSHTDLGQESKGTLLALCDDGKHIIGFSEPVTIHGDTGDVHTFDAKAIKYDF